MSVVDNPTLAQPPVQPTFNNAVGGSATRNEQQTDGLASAPFINDLRPQGGLESPPISNDSLVNGAVDGNRYAQASNRCQSQAK